MRHADAPMFTRLLRLMLALGYGTVAKHMLAPTSPSKA
jgi:hypothetical protein